MPKNNLFFKGCFLFIAFLLVSPVNAQVTPPAQVIQEAYYPEVIHAQGNVEIEQAMEPGQPVQKMKAKKGMRIRPGARIHTTDRSQVDIGVRDKYQMRIKEKSDVVAGSLAFNTHSRRFDTKYNLKKGSIYNRIQKDYLGEFGIESENINITAIGTEYGIDVWGPQNQTWVGMAQGEVEASDKLDQKDFPIMGGNKIDLGKDENGEVERIPPFALIDLRKELDKIGTGVDEDLDIRVFYILTFSTNRVYEFLDNTVILTNTNEPRALKQVFIPTVQMLPYRNPNKEKIMRNLQKIVFICNYYDDFRFSPHFLGFAGAIYNLMGDYKQAVELFESILSKYPRFIYASIIQCAIGVVYERNLKDARRAAEAYQKVIDNYPSSPEAEVAKLSLVKLGR